MNTYVPSNIGSRSFRYGWYDGCVVGCWGVLMVVGFVITGIPVTVGIIMGGVRISSGAKEAAGGVP